MDESEVREYVERSRSILEASPRMDEENTKVKLVQPFIDLLGWNLYSGEVELEYSVQMGRSSTKVDYALLLGDTPVVFIEAKGSNSNVSESDVNQLRSYMRQELEVDWGVVTNGKSFEVLTKNDGGRGEELSLVEFDLDDLERNPSLLEILAKDSIGSGKSDEIAEQIARADDAIRRLRQDKGEIARELSDVVEGEAGSLPIDTEAQAAEFVDGIVSTLEEQRELIGDRPVSGDAPDTEAPDESRYVIEMTDEGETVATFENERQSEIMGDAVEFLIEEFDLISRIEPLPFVPGRKKAIINDQPTYPDGEKPMITYQELTGGYYLDTHMNKAGKQRELRRLAERCELEIGFDGDW